MDELEYVGNMNVKVNMGWINIFCYKDFLLLFLIDVKFGGKVISMIEVVLDGWGVLKCLGEVCDVGGIIVDGVKFDVDKYYCIIGNNNFNSLYVVENYVYDVINICFCEVIFGYIFCNLLGVGKNLIVVIIGCNLFFFYKDVLMDLDVLVGIGNGI